MMSPSGNSSLAEFVETLRYELAEQGVPSAVHTDGFPEPTPERIYALPLPREFVALEGEDALPDDAVLKRTIFICADDPGTLDVDADVELLQRAGAVFNINSAAVPEFARAGIGARSLRPGYSARLDRFDPKAERDIDVLFFGAATQRRTRRLAACAATLARYNSCLLFSDASDRCCEGPTQPASDANAELLPRAKITLCIHQDDRGTDFDWLGALDAIQAGAVIVTEHSAGLAPLVAGEHLFAATPESLHFVLDGALRDPERLARMRAAAYERIRSWLPMALSVSVLRAAAVELVGRPTPPDVSLGRRLTRVRDRRSPALCASFDSEPETSRSDFGEVAVELIDLRRQVAGLERQLRQHNGGDLPPTVIHSSAAWNVRDRPAVTVVTALSNSVALVERALDSVSTCGSGKLELIVVDDGSSDDSLEAAAAWMTAHPWVPARLVDQGISRGLGAARNAALDAARGRYCLVLDPEMEPYPRCVDALARALDSRPEVSFAYPILETLGGIEPFADGQGDLQNVLDWDPDRLRTGNYIRSLAMIRVDLLRELGGFTTDACLAGWEDYDLWCRMAERGWSGLLVPQILARCRPPLRSMLMTNELSRSIAIAAVAEHAPKLLQGHPQVAT